MLTGEVYDGTNPPADDCEYMLVDITADGVVVTGPHASHAVMRRAKED